MPDPNRRRRTWTAAGSAAALAAAGLAAALLNRPAPRPAPSGNAVTVRSASDLRNVQSGKTYRGAPGVVIKGGDAGLFLRNLQNVTFEDLTFAGNRQNGVYIEGGSGYTFRRCTFKDNRTKSGLLTAWVGSILVEDCASSGNGEHGIYIGDSSDKATIRRCKLTGNTRNGLQINAHSGTGHDGLSTGNVVESCVITGNGGGFNLMGVRDSRFVNNLVVTSKPTGPVVALWDDGAGSSGGSRNCRFEHNTLLGGSQKYAVTAYAGSTGNSFLNCIIRGAPAFKAENPVQVDYCVVPGQKGNAAWGPKCKFADPKLGSDYRPLPGSPCRGAGKPGVAQTDLTGKRRGNPPAIGAYEP